MWKSLDQTDPIGLSDTYPVVFESGDPMGSDNAFYVGYDPATGEVEVADFN